MEKETEGKDKNQENNYYDKQPVLSNKGASKLRQQIARGMTTFLVIAAGIAFYFAILRFTNISGVFGKIVGILKPILYGLILAYLLNPMVKRIEGYLRSFFSKKIKREEVSKKLARGIGIFFTLTITISIVVALCNMVLPELNTSIRSLIATLPKQLNDWVKRINDIGEDSSTLGIVFTNLVNEGTTYIQSWVRTDLLKLTNLIMSSVTAGVTNVVKELLNFIIGIIISIYVMFSREVFSGQTKKVVYAILKPEQANFLLHITRKSNEIFGGFLIGKIIDSIIIGVLCFLCLSVMRMPYTLLVSVIVGVTNVIPFFGPYLGAVPSAILILLNDPIKGIYFIIFILILQQVDGNIIGPKILGDSTGLSAFWVVFSILLGGGLFGIPGMIMGVPTFAVIYYIVQMLVNQKLEKKQLPTTSESYDQMSYVDTQSGKFVYSEEYAKRKKRTEEKGEK